jgi:hypothetical protein
MYGEVSVFCAGMDAAERGGKAMTFAAVQGSNHSTSSSLVFSPPGSGSDGSVDVYGAVLTVTGSNGDSQWTTGDVESWMPLPSLDTLDVYGVIIAHLSSQDGTSHSANRRLAAAGATEPGLFVWFSRAVGTSTKLKAGYSLTAVVRYSELTSDGAGANLEWMKATSDEYSMTNASGTGVGVGFLTGVSGDAVFRIKDGFSPVLQSRGKQKKGDVSSWAASCVTKGVAIKYNGGAEEMDVDSAALIVTKRGIEANAAINIVAALTSAPPGLGGAVLASIVSQTQQAFVSGPAVGKGSRTAQGVVSFDATAGLPVAPSLSLSGRLKFMARGRGIVHMQPQGIFLCTLLHKS